MLSFTAIFVAIAVFTAAVNAETHEVTVSTEGQIRCFKCLTCSEFQFVNNCGLGTPVFVYQGDENPQGATTVSGELNGGIARLTSDDESCQISDIYCVVVEFTLQNTGLSQAYLNLTTGSGLVNQTP